jgi:hypothetical protein
MANEIGSIKVIVSFPGPGGAMVAASENVLAAFAGSSFGQVDVPDMTAGATAFAIPFGSIATGASAILIQNKMGQDAVLKINGSAALNDIPDNGVVLIGAAALPASAKLTSLSLTTTATVDGSTIDRKIDFYVLGDPT